MQVRTLRKHGNSCGDAYIKQPGKIYDHPSPQRLIADGVVSAEVAVPQGKAAKRKTAKPSE